MLFVAKGLAISTCCQVGISIFRNIVLNLADGLASVLQSDRETGPHLNIKTVFPKYGDSHVKD